MIKLLHPQFLSVGHINFIIWVYFWLLLFFDGAVYLHIYLSIYLFYVICIVLIFKAVERPESNQNTKAPSRKAFNVFST